MARPLAGLVFPTHIVDCRIMNLSKREFLQVMASASVAGMALGRYANADAATAEQGLYDIAPFGNVSLLHMTDCHAQLLPIYFREPNVNLGIGSMQGQLPHLVGEHLLKAAGVRPGTPLAHAYSYIDFERASRRYGRVGGFAHLAVEIRLGGFEFHGDLRPAPGGHGFEIGGQRGAVHGGTDELAGGGDGDGAEAYSAVPTLLSIRR
jgi:hypothetical protein